MSAFNTLTLFDGAATPVAQDFAPHGSTNGNVTVWRKLNDNLVVGSMVASLGMKESGGRFRRSLKLVVPTVEAYSSDGVTHYEVTETSYVNIDFNFGGRTSTTQRRDIVAMAASFVDPNNEVQISKALIDLEGIF